jgi:amicyanin
MKKLLLAFVMAAVLGVVLVSGCTQPAPPPSGNVVNIQNIAFNPQTITVSAGTTVTWTNLDGVNHQILADAGQADIADFSSPTMSQGSTYSYTFHKAGTWAYHCSIHTGMKGTVIVQ